MAEWADKVSSLAAQTHATLGSITFLRLWADSSSAYRVTGLAQTRFTPAQIDGRPVAEIVDVGFHFRPHLLAIEVLDKP